MQHFSSYPKVWTLGHVAITDLLKDPVVVQEKIDGSQISFGVDLDGQLLMRSKGAIIHQDAPEGMFKLAVERIQAVRHLLVPGWFYRGEYLAKPKHNVLMYTRVPYNNICLFDITVGLEKYLVRHEMVSEATRLGFEAVPELYHGMLESIDEFRKFLRHTSVLGGQPIEGVVIKNYQRFGVDGRALMGKFVSEDFKEIHAAEWKDQKPGQGEILEKLVEALRTPARWQKAVQHLQERGQLEGSPRDIGKLIAEVGDDTATESMDFIAGRLWAWAWPQLRRRIVHGLPEWYKEQLLKKQFEQQ